MKLRSDTLTVEQLHSYDLKKYIAQAGKTIITCLECGKHRLVPRGQLRCGSCKRGRTKP